MYLRTVRALRGPNLWGSATVLEVLVEMGPWASLDAEAVHEFCGRLQVLLPATGIPLCSECDQLEGWEDRLSPTLEVAAILARTVVALQVEAGSAVRFGRVAESSEPGVFRLVVEFAEEPVGRTALKAACDLMHAVRRGESACAVSAIRELRTLDQQIRLGPSTGSIVRAARRGEFRPAD